MGFWDSDHALTFEEEQCGILLCCNSVAKIEAIEMQIEGGSHMRRLPLFVYIDLVVAPHK